MVDVDFQNCIKANPFPHFDEFLVVSRIRVEYLSQLQCGNRHFYIEKSTLKVSISSVELCFLSDMRENSTFFHRV